MSVIGRLKTNGMAFREIYGTNMILKGLYIFQSEQLILTGYLLNTLSRKLLCQKVSASVLQSVCNSSSVAFIPLRNHVYSNA